MIALLPVAGVIITALVAYLVARRTTSGRIDTTEAKTLWDESTKMRKELGEELLAVRGELVSVRALMAKIEQRCAGEIKVLEAKIAALGQRP